MITIISNLKQISYDEGYIVLHYVEFGLNAQGYEVEIPKISPCFCLCQGVGITVYREGGILKAAVNTSNNVEDAFQYYGARSEILFEGSQTEQDIYGGFLQKSIYDDVGYQIRLKGINAQFKDLPVGALNLFHLSIIGVDDIRAVVGNPPQFMETYLLEEHEIFLRIKQQATSATETKNYLEVRYKKRFITQTQEPVYTDV